MFLKMYVEFGRYISRKVKGRRLIIEAGKKAWLSKRKGPGIFHTFKML